MKRGSMPGMLVTLSMALFLVSSLKAWPPPIVEHHYSLSLSKCKEVNCKVLISEWDHSSCTAGDNKKCKYHNNQPVVVCIRDLNSPECRVPLVGESPTPELNPICEGRCVSSGQRCASTLWKCKL
jgi:hypothetical protein